MSDFDAGRDTVDRYVDGLGGSRWDPNEEPEYTVRIKPPAEHARDVAILLSRFVEAIQLSANGRFSGLPGVAIRCGRRDGAFAIPGRGLRRGDADDERVWTVDGDADVDLSAPAFGLVRPSSVQRILHLGMAAMREADSIATIVEAQLKSVAGVADSSADVARSRRRRRLHVAQLGLLGLISVIVTALLNATSSPLARWAGGTTDGSLATGDIITQYGAVIIVALLCLRVLPWVAGRLRAPDARTMRIREAEWARVQDGPSETPADTTPKKHSFWERGRTAAARQPSALIVLFVTILLAAVLGVVGTRLSEWPRSSAAALLIVAVGITAGAYRALHQRGLAKLRQHERELRHGDPVVTTDQDLARLPADPLTRHAYAAGAVISMAAAVLAGLSGAVELDQIDTWRIPVGVLAWLVWGGLGFAAAVFLTRVSQDWISVLAAEIDLTEFDRSSAAQNVRSADTGITYVEAILHDHHLYVTEMTLSLVDLYYEVNLQTRNASRDALLDRFAIRDAERCRIQIEAAARRTP